MVSSDNRITKRQKSHTVKNSIQDKKVYNIGGNMYSTEVKNNTVYVYRFDPFRHNPFQKNQ